VIAESTMLMDLDSLSGGKKLFVNCSRDVIVERQVELLPAERTVVELLESVPADPEVLAGCRALAREGFEIALDDFVWSEATEPLLDVADIVKVDVLATPLDLAVDMAGRLRERGIRVLAEKVETHETFEALRGAGYCLFQGYFFSKPALVSAAAVPAYKLQLLALFREISRPELDLDGLERVIRQDVGLTYRLLRYINSVYFGFRNQVGSVRRALILLGQREIKRWTAMIVLTGVGEDRPTELVRQSVVRARFCELLGPAFRLDEHGDDLFLLGLLSSVDALVGRPMEEILESLPLDDAIRDALLRGSGALGPLYRFSRAWERGEWDAVDPLVAGGTSSLYVEAVRWGARAMAPVSATEPAAP
jgi:EAL and modified HD-GYP domain-containing signal transduction protein